MASASRVPAVPKRTPPAKSLPSGTGQKAAASTPASSKAINWGEFAVPIAVLGIILAMITPLPSFLLDILISANITMSVIVLLVSLYIIKPVEFSVFPTTLLLMTLFRLALNISSARLILLNGNTGTSAAGEVIQAFGAFVVGGNYIIGVVIFLVLIAIQYVVINHGAVRISEVTARFTLDAMPGKQMSIDSDLNAGLIDENEARTRRKKLASEAEFYGAMDGASRFTQRDAVASIIITAINIIAGFLIGVLQHGMDLKRALQTYTVLTIGDGLVTVIPALMISISGGLIVTRASSDTKLGLDFQRQVFNNPQPLFLASGVLLAMAAFPGLPKIPFLVLGSVGERRRVAAAAKIWRGRKNASSHRGTGSRESGSTAARRAAGGRGGAGTRAIGGRRAELPAAEENREHSAAAGYRTRLHSPAGARHRQPDAEGARIYDFDQGRGDHSLRTGARVRTGDPFRRQGGANRGIPTREPAFGLAATWISPDNVEKARRAGYTIVEPSAFWARILREVVRRHAHELFSRQDAKKVLDRVGRGESQGRRRFGSQIALPGSGAESPSEPIAGASIDTGRSQHS